MHLIMLASSLTKKKLTAVDDEAIFKLQVQELDRANAEMEQAKAQLEARRKAHMDQSVKGAKTGMPVEIKVHDSVSVLACMLS